MSAYLGKSLPETPQQPQRTGKSDQDIQHLLKDLDEVLSDLIGKKPADSEKPESPPPSTGLTEETAVPGLEAQGHVAEQEAPLVAPGLEAQGHVAEQEAPLVAPPPPTGEENDRLPKEPEETPASEVVSGPAVPSPGIPSKEPAPISAEGPQTLETGPPAGEAGIPAGDQVPPNIPLDQIRRVGFLYASPHRQTVDRFLSALDQLTQKVSKKPFFIVKTFVEDWNPDMTPAEVLRRARETRSVAIIAIFPEGSDFPASEMESVLSGARTYFQQISPEESGSRPVLVDLIVELLLLKPTLS